MNARGILIDFRAKFKQNIATMRGDLQNEFENRFPGVKFDEPLKRYCTFQVGGPAKYFYVCSDVTVLVELLKFAKENDVKVHLLGGGSNTLFADKGFDGLVIKMKVNQMKVDKDEIYVEAGANLMDVVNTAEKYNLTGMEEMYGLPGTVGGAVFGNAGCFGVEIKDVLIEAEVLDLENMEVKKVNNDFFEYGYRTSRLKSRKGSEIVLSATFKLNEVSEGEIKQKMKDIFTKRAAKQPWGSSSGSFFKNPPGDHSAGYLIDQCGLKGSKVGGAEISEKHGNFFMSSDNANSEDILSLAKMAKEKVKEQFGVDLHEEVEYID